MGEENQGIRITRTVAPLTLIVGIVPLVPLRLVGLMVIIPPRVAVPQVGGTLLAVVEVILPAVMMTTMMTRTNLPPPVVEVAVLRVGLPAPVAVAARPPAAVLVVPVPAVPVMVPAVAPQVAVVVDLVDPALVAKTRRQAKTAAAAAPRKHPAPKPQDQPKTQPVIRPRPAVSPIKSRRKNPPTATGHPTAASSTRLHKMKKSPQPRTRYHTLGSLSGAQSCLLA